MGAWSGFSCLRIGPMVGYCEYGQETSGYIEGGKSDRLSNQQLNDPDP